MEPLIAFGSTTHRWHWHWHHLKLHRRHPSHHQKFESCPVHLALLAGPPSSCSILYFQEQTLKGLSVILWIYRYGFKTFLKLYHADDILEGPDLNWRLLLQQTIQLLLLQWQFLREGCAESWLLLHWYWFSVFGANRVNYGQLKIENWKLKFKVIPSEKLPGFCFCACCCAFDYAYT